MADWTKIFRRGDVEDRRSAGPAVSVGLSLTTVGLVLLYNVVTGGSPQDILIQLTNMVAGPVSNSVSSEFSGEDEYEVFASTVLGSNNLMWSEKFNRMDRVYIEPRLVLFRTATESGCGYAAAQMGPHYCPADNTIYLDETFFDELTQRFGARGGDVAEAYVISHEVGHHVQNQLGFMGTESQNSNDRLVQIELQADCFAALWVNLIRDEGILESGEIVEAMDAAAAVGDDRIQEKVTGRVNPETWSHGSSQERVKWFNTGYESGQIQSCNTFSETNVNHFLEQNDIKIFDFIYTGSSMFGKGQILKKLLKSRNINPENVVYVGDETRDIEAARKSGVKIMSVTWGLNNEEVLSKHNPDWLARKPEDLLRF